MSNHDESTAPEGPVDEPVDQPTDQLGADAPLSFDVAQGPATAGTSHGLSDEPLSFDETPASDDGLGNDWALGSVGSSAETPSSYAAGAPKVAAPALTTAPALTSAPAPWLAPQTGQQVRRRMSTVIIVALISGVLGGGIGAQFFGSGGAGSSPAVTLNNVGGDASKRPANSIAGIAQRVLPAVVSVETVSGQGSGNGSGEIIESTGSYSYILTNNHVILEVVQAGGQINVQMQNGDRYSASVVGRDPSYDLAILRVSKGGLPVISMGDSAKVVVGDSVVAIGSPLGLTGTVTAGIVSALRRPVTTNPSNVSDETSFISAIQTDAAINPGNSGGPLVDAGGRMIGVNSAIATLNQDFTGQAGNIGVGFSIPINQARRVAEQIINTGRSTFPVIGVQLDREYAGNGARIGSVEAGGPASKVGLLEGDVITHIDGQIVADTTAAITTIRSYMPGDTIRITILRGSRPVVISVTLGSRQSL